MRRIVCIFPLKIDLSMNVKKVSVLSFLFFFIVSCISCKRELVETPSDERTEDAVSSLSNAAKAKKGPLSVVYVEVNDNNILNAGCYTLKNSGQQLFDIAIIFAANINYDVANKRAIEYNNPQVSNILQNKNTYIKPLQDKGIKVLMTILGNHGGAGISNFTSRAAAHDFAKQLSDTVNTYGLDGIDFDDEFSDYGKNGLPQPNDSSFVLLLSECRKLMPKKVLTFYFFGPASQHLTYKNLKAGTYLNASWNADYGTFQVPNVPGLAKSKLSPASVEINATSETTAKSLASQTIGGGYGAYLYYNLTSQYSAKFLSSVSTVLYNDSAVADPSCTQILPPPPPPPPPPPKDTTGVVFFADAGWGGSYTRPIPKGDHTLTDLMTYGFQSNWASSLTMPKGWTVRVFYTSGLKGEPGLLFTQDTSYVGDQYNDFINSCRIQ